MLKLSMYKNSFIKIISLMLMIPSICVSASFSLSDNKNLQVHGFASQSAIYTDSNNFFGESSDNGSIDYTEIGANISLQAWKKLHTAVQLLSRRAGEFDNGKIKLDFAIADYQFKQDSKYGLGMRFGRVKNSFGFYNDTRDVAFTRASILLPQSIYFERTRDLSISSDGVQLYGHRDFQPGSVQFQFLVSRPRVTDENTELAVLNDDLPGDFVGKPTYVAKILLSTHSNSFKIALSDVILNMEYDPTSSETGFNGNARFEFHLSILSLQYNYMNWSFTGEYARRKIDFKGMFVSGFPLPTFVSQTVGESYYLQLSYRINYQWKILTRYDVLYQNRDDRDGSDYAEQWALLGDTSKPAHSRFAKDVTLGVQWDINNSWMLRMELHSINGTGWLPLQDNPNLDSANQKWRMATASVSYRF